MPAGSTGSTGAGCRLLVKWEHWEMSDGFWIHGWSMVTPLGALGAGWRELGAVADACWERWDPGV